MNNPEILRGTPRRDPPKVFFAKAIPHNSKCRYGERGAADAKPKAQIILDAAKVSAASGGNSEPRQGALVAECEGLCPRSTMRVPQPDIIEHFGNADAVPQLPERCLSRKAGIVRCCLRVQVFSASHWCMCSRIRAKAVAVSGLCVLKSISFHSQPWSATMQRLSG